MLLRGLEAIQPKVTHFKNTHFEPTLPWWGSIKQDPPSSPNHAAQTESGCKVTRDDITSRRYAINSSDQVLLQANISD